MKTVLPFYNHRGEIKAPSFKLTKLSKECASLVGVYLYNFNYSFRNQYGSLITDRGDQSRITDPDKWHSTRFVQQWGSLTKDVVKELASRVGISCIVMSDRVNKTPRIGWGEVGSNLTGTSVFMRYLIETCPSQVMQFPIGRNVNYYAKGNFSLIQPIMWYPFTTVPKDKRVIIPLASRYLGNGPADEVHKKVNQDIEDSTAFSFSKLSDNKVRYL